MKKISRRSFLTVAGATLAAGALSACSTSASTDDTTWIIAMDTVFVPFEYTDENGNFVGIDVDIMNAVAADQGFSVELNSLGWDAALAAVESGQADGLMAGASITQERIDNGWIFSDGYYDGPQTVAVKSESTVASFADLQGATVAVKNGTMGASYAESLAEEYSLNVVKFDDSPTMYQDVLAGNSEACFEDLPVMAAYIKTMGLDLRIPEGMEGESSLYGFAIRAESAQPLLDMFNAGLANIKADGTYDEILATYLG